MSDILDRRKMVAELAAHGIRVGLDGTVTICGHAGPKTMPKSQALAYIKGKAQENAEFLIDMWKMVAGHPVQEGQYPSNDGTRRMFVSALKYLTSQSSSSRKLKEMGIHEKLCGMLLKDSQCYSQDVMNKFIDYRLVIDWMTHLVSYDIYRAELLECLPEMDAPKINVSIRTAQAYGRDFSIPSEQSIPWSQYKDRLYKHRAEPQDAGSDKSLIERDNELRTEQGLEDYDAAKTGLMHYIYENNQKVVDHTSGEFGIRDWNDKENVGPAERRTTVWGR